MNIELKETSKFQQFPTSKTERVLDKWSQDGEIQKENIRKAASDYAKLEVNNRILKWIIATVVVFLFVLLGFMIASVVLGVHITKEVQVKNGQLVSSSGNHSVVKTSTVQYHNKITLNSPASVIDSLNSLSININDGLYQGVLQFDVISYEFIPGKQLTFYGHSHQADVMPDGTVKLTSLLPYTNKRDGSTGSTGTSVSGTSSTSGSSNVIFISSCEGLASIQESGFYQLTSSLSCPTLTLPLLSGKTFNGNLDGQGFTLTLNSVNTGSVALFETLGGSIVNLQVDGVLQGVGNCATFAVTALGGAYLSKDASFATINCASGASGSNVAGGFFAYVQPSTTVGNNVQILNSVSQVAITFNDASAVVGGFYGFSKSDNSITTFSLSATDAKFTTTGKNDSFGLIGINNTPDCQKEINYCLVDVGLTNQEFDCCYPIERTPNNPDDNNCDSLFCYDTRDTSPRNTAKRSTLLKREVIGTSTKVHPFYERSVCY